jgi:ubiquinone/menaquinone biosynthesis C-methylase UbiE
VYQPIDTKTVTGYWYSYLLGREGESEGYDFYGNLREFRDFISREAVLLDPQPGQVIADMGCGTGLLTAALLKRIVDNEKTSVSGNVTRIVATDLIPEALNRTREKCRFLLGPEQLDYDRPDVVRRGSVSVHFAAANLEPDTSRPLCDFIRHRHLPVTFLKGRIDGLMDRVVDRWHAEGSAELAAYLRGDNTPQPPDTPEPDRAREIHLTARRIIDGTGVREDEIEPHSCDAVVASLFISYILNHDYLLYDFHRMLKPGGTVLVSSMRPDSDVSKIFTGYIEEVDAGAADASHRIAAKAMLNEAASLFELEEEGYFRFYTEDELRTLLSDAGFRDVRVVRSLGDPPQAYIATGIAIEDPPEPWEKYV